MIKKLQKTNRTITAYNMDLLHASVLKKKGETQRDKKEKAKWSNTNDKCFYSLKILLILFDLQMKKWTKCSKNVEYRHFIVKNYNKFQHNIFFLIILDN